ncbi:Crp/Fnr family transcriptional regulator [Streptomyces sp. R21]|uniref:Crp/Fnr family transcriptional regulator n=1 Tax=Streptomyces sp. R21 TaxID=3238627 RepID=A0AB39PLL2_9ACTN
MREIGIRDPGKVPLLARLESADRTDLLALGRQMNFASRAVLFHQGEPSTHVLCLVNGWTKVTAAAPNGYEALLALRGPGDVVGEASAILGHPQSETVTALEPVVALVVSGESFLNFMDDRPAVAREVLRLSTERTRAADRRRLESASMNVRERFAVLLLDLARTHGRRTPEGLELAIPLTQQELAGSVGASREMIQRLLKELRDRGAVITRRRTIVIERPDVLRRIAGHVAGR